MKEVKTYPIYGVMAEFETPHALILATKAAYGAGYRVMDAYTPFPIEEVSEVIGFHRKDNKVPLATLIGGILGGIGGFSLASLASSSWYPLNIAGRPLIPWPAFIPVTFECSVKCSRIRADNKNFMWSNTSCHQFQEGVAKLLDLTASTKATKKAN